MNENSADFISSLLKTIKLDPIAATTLFKMIKKATIYVGLYCVICTCGNYVNLVDI